MNVVVYCSSVDNLPQHWQDAASRLGKWIGSHKTQLVYGGVESGLMKITSTAAKDSGAKIVGVVPARRLDAASPLNDVQVPTSDLNDRKGVMQMLGDIFVVLPGGYGTLDEFTTSFSYLNFTCQKKNIIVVNLDGIFDNILAQLRIMAEKGLMKPEQLAIVTEASSSEEMIAALEESVREIKQ